MKQKIQTRHDRLSDAYKKGCKAYKNGILENEYSYADLMEYCAWSAGYFDAKRGLAGFETQMKNIRIELSHH